MDVSKFTRDELILAGLALLLVPAAVAAGSDAVLLQAADAEAFAVLYDRP